MKSILEDRVLIKAKDIILLLMAIAGLLAGINRYYRLPFRVEEIESKVEQRAAKYIPMIEQNDKQLAVITSQYTEIIRRLDRIEKKP